MSVLFSLHKRKNFHWLLYWLHRMFYHEIVFWFILLNWNLWACFSHKNAHLTEFKTRGKSRENRTSNIFSIRAIVEWEWNCDAIAICLLNVLYYSTQDKKTGRWLLKAAFSRIFLESISYKKGAKKRSFANFQKTAPW